jgi:hypothetical protein
VQEIQELVGDRLIVHQREVVVDHPEHQREVGLAAALGAAEDGHLDQLDAVGVQHAPELSDALGVGRHRPAHGDGLVVQPDGVAGLEPSGAVDGVVDGDLLADAPLREHLLLAVADRLVHVAEDDPALDDESDVPDEQRLREAVADLAELVNLDAGVGQRLDHRPVLLDRLVLAGQPLPPPGVRVDDVGELLAGLVDERVLQRRDLAAERGGEREHAYRSSLPDSLAVPSAMLVSVPTTPSDSPMSAMTVVSASRSDTRTFNSRSASPVTS